MSTITRNGSTIKKTVAFVLIITLLIGGFSTFALGGFAGTEGFKVAFTVDNAKDEYTVTSEDNQAVNLPKEIIPDDPKAGENETFLGWRNLSGDTKEEREAFWSAKDLKDFVVDEDTEFEAVFEEIETEDPVTEDGADNSVDENQTEQQFDNSENGIEEEVDKKKDDDIGIKAFEHLSIAVDSQNFTPDTTSPSVVDWILPRQRHSL